GVNGDVVTMSLQTADGVEYQVGDTFTQDINLVDALLESEYEETANRVATAIASVEKTEEAKKYWQGKFKDAIENFNLVPS
ncbi:hypothetical protein SB749_20490, partial [Brevibacterium sp. SIMBA_078]|uniref:hypothetical protein n=1 Tax=Brevibacterium sp. SIMBA_078 TaxID=3085816 RepID=UPI00397A51F2